MRKFLIKNNKYCFVFLTIFLIQKCFAKLILHSEKIFTIKIIKFNFDLKI